MAFKQRTYTEVPHDETISPQIREFLASLLSQVNALSGQGTPTTGQGIQALSLNTVDPTTGQIVSAGSRVSSVTTALGFIASTNTAAVGSVTFFWDGSNGSQVFKIGRDDGSVYGPNPAGSPLVVTGLPASATTTTTYYFYPYFDEALQKIVFASVPGQSIGMPPLAFPAQSFKAAQQQIMRGHVALALSLSATGVQVPAAGTTNPPASGGTGGAGTGAAKSVATGTSIQVGDGSAAAPAYSFASNPNTGFYRSGSNQITAAVAGLVGPTFRINGIALGTDTQFLSFGAAGDTAISRVSANFLAVGNGTQGDTSGKIKSAQFLTSGSLNSGVVTEVSGTLIDIGMNDDSTGRFGGTFTPASQGGLVRIDTRAGFPLFQIQGRAAGSSSNIAQLLAVNSDGSVNFSGPLVSPSITNPTLASPSISNPTTTGTDSGTETLQNKRITPRVVSLADGTSFTLSSDAADLNTQVNTQAAGTLTANAPAGTPTDGQKLTFRIKSTNVQTYAWNAIFRGSTTNALPTSTSGGGKTDYIGFTFNAADTKWDCTSVDMGH